MKWVVIILGGFLVVRFLGERNTSSGVSSSGGSVNGTISSVVNSLTSLTNSIGHLFNRDATTVKDPDALVSPSF